jgi:GTPase Era involved in 16S rRNA processing
MLISHHSGRFEAALSHANELRGLLDQLGPAFAADSQELADLTAHARSERVLVAIVGSSKRGKSTLVNGLLGRRDDLLAPVGRFPATNVVSVFANSPSELIRVHFEDGRTQDIRESEIRSFACEDGNPANVKQVSTIEIHGAFPTLETGVCIADMPGSDNALASQHAQALYLYLPRADAIIFLVAADEPINNAERMLLRHLRGAGFQSLIVAVNKRDLVHSGDIDDSELREGVAHNKQILADAGFAGCSIHEISAKDFAEGRAGSGVERLVAELQSTLKSRRGELVADRLEHRTRAVLDRVRARIGQEVRLAKSTTEELEQQRAEILSTRRILTTGRAAREARFNHEWNAALDDFEAQIKRSARALSDRYRNIVEQARGSELTSLLETIHSDVHLALQEQLRPAVDACNERLSDAQRELLNSMGEVKVSMPTFRSIEAARVPADRVKDILQIGGAAAPSLLVGTAALAAPSAVGAIIASAAPAAVSASFNPLTWGPALASSVGATAVGATQGVAVATVGLIATPISVLAVSYAGYRSYRAWRSARIKERNDLQRHTDELIQGTAAAMADELRSVRRAVPTMLSEFHSALELRLNSTDEELERLARNRPSPEAVVLLETSLQRVERFTTRLALAPSAPTAVGRLMPGTDSRP